jgi:hypothetical protein
MDGLALPELDALRTYRARLFVRRREVKCKKEGERVGNLSQIVRSRSGQKSGVNSWSWNWMYSVIYDEK